MCKIMLIPGSKDALALNKFMRAAFPHLTEDDDDAFGYAAVSPTTGLFGERWTDMDSVFQLNASYSDADNTLIGMLGEAIHVPDKATSYNKFGVLATDAHSVILHGRYATCGKGLENAHPFVSKDTALVHNGVIQNAVALNLNTQSTCDSEVILELYKKHDVRENMEHVQAVADELSGWYACGVLTKKSGRWILDVFRDAQAQLYVTWIAELGTMVFCTSEEIILKTCLYANMTPGTIFKVQTETLTRIDCLSGNVIGKTQYVADLYFAKTYNFPSKAPALTNVEKDLYDLDRVIGETARRSEDWASKGYDAEEGLSELGLSEQVDDVWEYMTNREKAKLVRHGRRTRGK